MESYKLYNSAVELLFDPIKHRYSVDGVVVDGVTTILKVINKPALVNWSANMSAGYVEKNLKPGVALDEVQIMELVDGAKKAHRVRADQTASLGTLAHAWFDDHFSGRAPTTPVNPELRRMTGAFLKFADTHKVEVLETERRLYSQRFKFAGTVDLICKVDGELTVADYKTGSGIYAEMLAQCGGYHLCYEEETGTVPSRHMLINCNAKGELTVAVSANIVVNQEAFLDALNLSRRMKALADDMKAIKTPIL